MVPLDGVDDGDGEAQASGPPPKVVPGMPHGRRVRPSLVQSVAPHGDGHRQELGEGGDVGLDAEVLVGTPLSCAAQPA